MWVDRQLILYCQQIGLFLFFWTPTRELFYVVCPCPSSSLIRDNVTHVRDSSCGRVEFYVTGLKNEKGKESQGRFTSPRKKGEYALRLCSLVYCREVRGPGTARAACTLRPCDDDVSMGSGTFAGVESKTPQLQAGYFVHGPPDLSVFHYPPTHQRMDYRLLE